MVVTVLFPVLLIYAGFLCLVAFRKKEKGLAQLQTDVMLLVLFAAVTAAGFFMHDFPYEFLFFLSIYKNGHHK